MSIHKLLKINHLLLIFAILIYSFCMILENFEFGLFWYGTIVNFREVVDLKILNLEKFYLFCFLEKFFSVA